MLSVTKHLDPANEILRGVYTECNECAQDDTSKGDTTLAKRKNIPFKRKIWNHSNVQCKNI